MREITEKEVQICNAVGVIAALVYGFTGDANRILIGLLLTYVAAIPVIWIYILFKRLLGDKIQNVKIQFRPGITWAGKKYEL